MAKRSILIRATITSLCPYVYNLAASMLHLIMKSPSDNSCTQHSTTGCPLLSLAHPCDSVKARNAGMSNVPKPYVSDGVHPWCRHINMNLGTSSATSDHWSRVCECTPKCSSLHPLINRNARFHMKESACTMRVHTTSTATRGSAVCTGSRKQLHIVWADADARAPPCRLLNACEGSPIVSGEQSDRMQTGQEEDDFEFTP